VVVTFLIDKKMKIEFEHYGQLIALSKTLFFVKCQSQSLDIKELVMSPYTGQLLSKVMKELEPYYQEHLPSYKFENEFIESNPEYMETVKFHIKNVENWHELSHEIKLSIIKTLIEPMNYQEYTIEDILKTA